MACQLNEALTLFISTYTKCNSLVMFIEAVYFFSFSSNPNLFPDYPHKASNTEIDHSSPMDLSECH